MEKVKNITEKTRIVTVVINVKDEEEYYYGLNKKNNPNVRNWVVNDYDEAKKLVEQLIYGIKNTNEEGAKKSKRVDGCHWRVYFGDNYDESVITWDFKITGIHE